MNNSLISNLKNLDLNLNPNNNTIDNSIMRSNNNLSNNNSKNFTENLSKKITTPFPYQEKIFQKIKDINSIVFMETGKGKTYIAVMLIKHLLQKEENKLNPNKAENPENLYDKQMNIKEKIRLRNNNNNKVLVDQKENKIFKYKTKCVFLVTESILVLQQKNMMKENLPENINIEQISTTRFKSKNIFDKFWDENTLFFTTPVLLMNLLIRGLIKISDIDLLIFDECHHADKKTPYFLLMNEFYFFHQENSEYNLPKLPQILGLTASPLKKKIRQDIEVAGREALEIISNNLNCKMVIDPEVMEFNYINCDDDNIKNINSADAKREYVEVENHKERISYKFLEELLMSELYGKIVDLCFEKYLLLGILEKKAYLRYIKNKTECENVEEYNKITAREKEFYEMRIKYSLFNILEILQRQILMLIENLDFFSIESLITNNIDIYRNEYHKLNKENQNKENKKNNKYDIDIDQVKKLFEIFSNFLSVAKTQKKSNFFTSPRLEKLKEKVKEIIENDIKNSKNHRIIIFVQNRIVSEMLSKIINNFLNEEFNKNNNLSLNKEYKCTFIVGINKRKSQNCFDSNISKEKLNENLEDFKKGKCQILIGTSTVEEGIDVRQCDHVIVFTSLKTAKSYIQMKGRARMANAIFSIFTENRNQMVQNIKDFVDLIIFIRNQFKNNTDGILKDFRTNLHRRKFLLQEENADFFVIKKSMAKVTINNVKVIYNEIIQKVRLKDKTLTIEEKYEEKRKMDLSGSPLFFKCFYRIKGDLIKFEYDSEFRLSKDDSLNNCLVCLIWYMHEELGILDDNLNILI